MNTLSKAKRVLEDVLDRIFPKQRVLLTERIRNLLRHHPLRIVDVGGAMGPDERWRALGPGLCRFVTFEPDLRSFDGLVVDPSGRHATLSVALADAPGERMLHLTQGAFASSLYPPNADILKDFAVWPWYKSAGQRAIKVDTLDRCLTDHPDWRPDYLKIDAEGADLDILIGAVGCLPEVLALQVEVAFIERNIGTPLQPNIDLWLRTNGFVLHRLVREHWVRANALFGATSQPQLVWADALYLRDRNSILAMLAKADDAQRTLTLTRMVVVLLVYGAHDYALDLVEAARAAEGGADSDLVDDLRLAITGSVIPVWPFLLRGGVALLLALAVATLLLPFGRRGRNVGGAVIAKQAAPLFHAAYRSAARSGIGRSCIADPS